MVAKKRSGLRAKAAKAGKTEKQDVGNERAELPPDPKAFLHQPRETKKEKSQSKTESFLSRVAEKSRNLSGISKSSLRRRKRKTRDELKPKMNDLLVSLQQEGVVERNEGPAAQEEQKEEKVSVTKVSASSAYGSISASEHSTGPLRKNEPNIRNQKGAKLLAKQETKRFNEVLMNESFQKSPFDALKEAIRMRQ